MRTNNSIVVALLGFLLSVVGGTVAGAAAPSSTPIPVTTPWVTSADHELGGAVFNHAAGLAMNEGSEIALGFTLSPEGDVAGDGVFGSVATSLGPIHFGLGLARLGNGLVQPDMVLRTDLGLAFSLGRNASVGVGWTGLSADATNSLDDFNSWSLSATLRPIRSLALGLDIDGLNTPSAAGVSRPVSGRLDIALRPGTERLAFGFEGGVDFADNPNWSVGAGLRTMLIDGLTVGAFGRYIQEQGADGHLEWGVNLALGQGNVSVSSSLLSGGQSALDSENLRVSTLLSYSSKAGASLVGRSAMVVALDVSGTLPERPGGGLLAAPRPALADWLAAFASIENDDSVAALLLRIKGAPNWSQCWELREAIQRLKRAGKKVYASLQVGDMRSVYLASVADKVFLDPAGALMISGLSITQTYLTGAMEKLGVRAQFIAFEQHKTYPERFTRSGPSPASKAQTSALLEHFMSAWLEGVSTGRNLEPKKLQRMLSNGPLTMKDALQEGLVDELVDDSALKKAMERDLGHEVRLTRGYRPNPRAWRRWGGSDAIAIVPIVGSISGGETGPAVPLVRGPNTGERSLVRTLRMVEKDDRYRGAVIRIDSPGGGVVPSDVIYRAVKRLSKKKPVVVNFGNVAASGGYYVAMGGRSIVASPMTITGSIGIFAGKADLSGLYEKLGLTTDSTVSQEGADLMSMTRPWTDDELKRLRRKLGVYYERFLSIVAKGRGMTTDEVRERAGGRVVDGAKALQLKMIDSHGSLWDALKAASAQAGMESVRYRYVPEAGGLAGLLRGLGIGRILSEVSEVSSPLMGTLGPLLHVVADVMGANHGESMARMPMKVEVL